MTGRDLSEKKKFDSVNKKVQEMPEYVALWYMNLKASDCTAATCRDYVYKVEKFLKSINPDIEAVKPEDITEITVTKYFLSVKEKTTGDGGVRRTSDSYQGTVWTCLNNFLEFMARHNMISTNYMSMIKKPKNHDLDRINKKRIQITSEMFQDLRRATFREYNVFTRNRDRAVLMILMCTGMRETALTNIMLEDVDLVKRTISITDKGKKDHVYDINDKLMKDLVSYLDVRERKNDHNSLHLFFSKDSDTMSSRMVSRIVQKYSEIAFGYPVTPHKLRAGYCSILYQNTSDIEFVRRAVGHASSETTQRYIVTNGDERKRASEIIGNLI